MATDLKDDTFLLLLTMSVIPEKIDEALEHVQKLTDAVRKADGVGVPVYYFYKGDTPGSINGIEIYASDGTFMSHLAQFAVIGDSLTKLSTAPPTAICYGDPSNTVREVLKNFGTVYKPNGSGYFDLAGAAFHKK